MKPVVEIQFFDYIWPAMHQLRNELPLMRWRPTAHGPRRPYSRAHWRLSHRRIDLSFAIGREHLYSHARHRVVFPSNALDANGLLRTAIRCDDPVLFLEHKRLYRETYGRRLSGPDFAIPFGKAKIVRPGADISLITYGAVVPRALQAARARAPQSRIDVEILDLRTLNPMTGRRLQSRCARPA